MAEATETLQHLVDELRLENADTLNDPNVDPAETPESARFRSLPQALQRRLLVDYPRILATAMHQYSQGGNCEDILLQVFEGSPEMLSVPNTQGDNPMAAALVRGQGDRADKLVDLAHRRRPQQLDSRSQYGETLLMLSTLSSSSASLMERLLLREPTQLHRLYDSEGRNFLHHCAMEESIEALDAGLQVTLRLLQEDRLVLRNVSAAVHMNDSRGDTPLHLMAARNRVDMMQRLVRFCAEADMGIHLDERQHQGSRWTPLMSAVAAGAVQSAEFLLNQGADPDEEDTEGQTAASMAAAGDDEKMRQMFECEGEGAVGGGGAAQEMSQDIAVEITQEMAQQVPWTMSDQPVHTVDSGISTLDELPSMLTMSTRAAVQDERMRQNADCTGYGMALKAKKQHQPMHTWENCIGILQETDECMEQEDAMNAGTQEATEISLEELQQLEVHLKQIGKTMEFLNAVSRSVIPHCEIPPIVNVVESPLLTAFGYWNCCDKRLLSRSLVTAAMREVDQA